MNGDVLLFLSDYLKEANSELYDLSAFAIMPNHIHLLVKPLLKLAPMMQRIKGQSAIKINRLLGHSGTFWAADYFDKAVRDEKHYRVVYHYIKNNPLKLVENCDVRFYGIHEQ
ncbi:transposase [Psychromonas sp. PT13]|uniref:transposase n=1 Tax=Psychromonas sp. PT13 TaxID=3439547 RepID=UPI003EBD0158